ncbi:MULTISPECIES: hypothetical protein [Pseudomonas]|uniref:hypothetical protein n=1 Tax=Pseudomonas TaxID=286 RepID=UPI000897A56E|nr:MULTISPECIES: hypothetical protein [Pseudomonas]SDZ28702.1 hypothetical protein SAMN03159453_03023 [Pseudomonas sp. NFIX28]
MASDEDFILVPNLIPNTRFLRPIAIKRWIAKELVAAKGNSQAIYKLSLQYRVPLQAASYISNLELAEIERSIKYK